jgi:NADPH2:quinone reductase
MKAILYERYGSPEVLQMREIPKPVPRKDEILIKIRATSVTTSEAMMRQGKPYFGRPVIGLTKPIRKILGLEFAGEVAALGADARKFNVGDRVFGFTGFRCGAYAQYTCLPQSDSVIPMPDNVSFEEAAALVDGPTTALFFLQKAKIKRGDRVLINGASGSIGTAAVQLAAYFGADVTAVCSGPNAGLAKSLGARETIDYRQEDFTLSDETYDIIFDTVGKASYSKCKPRLRKSGRYLVTVMGLESIGQTILTSLWGDKRAIFAMSVGKNAELKFIKDLVEKGLHKPVIDKSYPLERIGEAHAYIDAGHKRGNVVISVSHDD